MCCVGVFHGLKALTPGTFQAKRTPVSCDKWTCDECRPLKAKKLYARLMNGGLLDLAKVDGFRSKYAVKLLTLTCPGKEYRNAKSPKEAYADMARSFDKLIRALKKKHGTFHYFRVREFHADGFPHFHVLLSGINIAPKYVLNDIRSLWQRSYKMGNVDIQVRKRNQTIEKAIRYIFKYIHKSPECKPDFKKVRLFTASRNALDKDRRRKQQWLYHKLNFGKASKSSTEKSTFEFSAGTPLDKIPEAHRRIIINAEFFLGIRLLRGTHGKF